MVGIDRENSSSAGMAQPDEDQNSGVAQEGGTLALMPWGKEGMGLMSTRTGTRESNNII